MLNHVLNLFQYRFSISPKRLEKDAGMHRHDSGETFA